VVATHGHRRQPRLHARAAGGPRARGGEVVMRSPVVSGRVDGREIVIEAGQGVRARVVRTQRRQCGRPDGARDLTADRRRRGRARAAAVLRERALLLAERARSPFRHLVYRLRAVAGSAFTSRSISRARRGSDPTSSGSRASTTRSTTRGAHASPRRSGLLPGAR
jgi:hypothetical protein